MSNLSHKFTYTKTIKATGKKFDVSDFFCSNIS